MEPRRAFCAFRQAFYPWALPTSPLIAPQPVLLASPPVSCQPRELWSPRSPAKPAASSEHTKLGNLGWIRTMCACVCEGGTCHSPHSPDKGDPVSTILAPASKFIYDDNSLWPNICAFVSWKLQGRVRPNHDSSGQTAPILQGCQQPRKNSFMGTELSILAHS